jgi:sec-independent protein translocase protein TatB
MFDIGWTELLLIGIVALIVVGPKDLPVMFRTLGRLIGKARAMAREFQRAMEQAADESGVKDMAREFKDSASGRDFGADELRNFAKGPKAWAREAAKKSVLKETGDAAKPADAKPADAKPADAAAPAADTAATEAAPPRPRGPATEALAAARAEAAEARRTELAARQAASRPDATPAPDDGTLGPSPTDRP